MKTKSIILMGNIGCGKGTQAKLLAKELNYKIIGVGDILREEQHKDTERGIYTKNLIHTGQLFPDQFINELMVEVMSEYIKNEIPFILEGYPRTLNQAMFMDSMLNIDKIFFIDVSDEEVTKRLLKRGETSGRGDDSSIEIINYRIKQFREVTLPIKEHYHNKGNLHLINGEESIENIFEKITELI